MNSQPRPSGVITITTDFGHQGPFVGVMKGCILTRFAAARIVDLTHEIVVHWPAEAGFWLARAFEYFPTGTVHIAVVDPGVGTARRPLLVAGDTHYFVAPDNGVLSAVYDQSEAVHAFHINAEHYFLNPVSTTFHGRDIFAPTAAWLSKTWQTQSFGEEVEDFVRFAIPKPKATGNTIKCVVLRVDHFGNLVTNLKPEDAPALVAPDGKFTIRVGNGMTQRMVGTFSDGAAGEPVASVQRDHDRKRTIALRFVKLGVQYGGTRRNLDRLRRRCRARWQHHERKDVDDENR